MSGGHFDYAQYRLEDIADSIDRLIATNDDDSSDEWGCKKGRGFSPEVIERFREAAHVLRQAGDMAERVDWLVSGDDGEDSFLRRWDKEVRKNYNATDSGLNHADPVVGRDGAE